MKVSDALTGAILIALGAWVWVTASGFPPFHSQKYGPSLFPQVVAAAFAVFGVLLIAAALRERRALPLVSIGEWTRRPRLVANVATVLGSLLFFILALDRLGFVATGLVSLLVPLVVLRGMKKVISSTAIAIVTTVAIYLFFGKLFRVPLPWGLLEPLLR